MFGGQTSKNLYDVRKVCLATTLYVYVCFIEFYVFFMDETYMLSSKLVYEHIWDKNVRVWIHLGPARGPKGGAQHWSSTLPGSGNRRTKPRPVNQETERWWLMLMDPLLLKVWELQVQPMRPLPTGLGLTHVPSMHPSMSCLFLPASCLLEGWNRKFTPSLIKCDDGCFEFLWVF